MTLLSHTSTVASRTVVGMIACLLFGTGTAAARNVCAAPELPPVTLAGGDFYFSVADVPTVLPGTNPWAPTVADFSPLLAGAGAHDKVVRLFVHSLWQNPRYAGDVDETWIANWESVLCDAQANGLYVLLALDVWPNWNDEARPDVWDRSIYNVNNSVNPNCGTVWVTCGPAVDPGEILQEASATREAWLDWVEGVVAALGHHSNIVGYEIFSEIDNISETNGTAADETLYPCAFTGTDLPLAVCLMEQAAARIRTADPGTPITASTAGVKDWEALSNSSLDFLQLHPYTDADPIDHRNLDVAILEQVRARREAYGKPVFIGESGLDQIFPDLAALTLHERGSIAVNQAIWAGVVSGAMNARMLWVEDGYDNDGLGRVDLCSLGLAHFDDEQVCEDGGTLTLHEYYANASEPVANFLADVDYSGFEYRDLTLTNVVGGALGNDTRIIGWVRDLRSAYDASAADPYWPGRDVIGETVSVALAAASVAPDWIVEFYETTHGTKRVGEDVVVHPDANGTITFTLPTFDRSIAFKIRAADAIQVQLNITPRFPRHNNMNLQFRHGFVVVILTTSIDDGDAQDFDAATVDPSSVRVGPLGAAAGRSAVADFQQDADLDLALAFRMDEPGFPCGQSELVLVGETNSGRSIVGSGPIRVIGCGP